MTTENRPAPICFVDTETLGLDPEAPVWEFAAIRREWPLTVEQWGGDVAATVQDSEAKFHCFIDHREEPWVTQMSNAGGAQFLTDYRLRFDASQALTTYAAAQLIHQATQGAHIVGAVPSFDTERLATLLHSRGFEPAWHYHLCDCETLAIGYLAAAGNVITPPWKSDTISRAIGVEPDDFQRHTAMGDCLWARAQYDTVMAPRR